MRKLIVILCCFGSLIHAQNGNFIHDLFGVSDRGSGIKVFEALNQNNGGSVEIETLPFNFELGNEFLYSTSSNDISFIDTVSSTASFMYQYLSPIEYTQTYTGLQNTTTLQGQGYNELFATNLLNDTLFYTYNHEFSTINSIEKLSHAIVNSTTFSINNLSIDDNLNYFENNLYLCSANGTNVDVYIFNASSLLLVNQFQYSYTSMYLVGFSGYGLYGVAKNTNEEYKLISLDSTGTIIEIGLLPSCSNCINETFSYDKNALTIDTANNSLILARSETISSQTSYYISSFSLSNAQPIYNFNTPYRYSHLMLQKPADDLVYPGDANHDKTVGMEDIFAIGIHYNDIVDFRSVISTDWIGQFAFSTNDTLANGVDIKHADCNGDGSINDIDIEDGVLANYHYTHNSEKSTQSTCDFPLYVVFPQLYKENDSATIKIGLDLSNNLAQQVYGIKFTLEFDTNFVQSSSMHARATDDWFGIENNNYLLKYKNDFAPNKMDVGVVGIDKINRSGGGILIDGIWTMEDEVIPITNLSDSMLLRITNVKIIDFYENEIDACGLDTFVVVYDKTVGIRTPEEAKVFDFYPNPIKNNNIYFSNHRDIETVEIFSLQGKLISSYSNIDNTINIGELNNGVYLIKAKDKNATTYTNKLAINR
ncbi:MAG: T9SS type A sorting domain-containing protein [Chitinophagales bacterium]